MGDDDKPPPIVSRGAALRTALGTPSISTVAPPPLFLQGLFRDPVSEVNRPLPPHTYSLESTSVLGAAVSVPTDEDGITTLALDLTADPASEWVLTWEPVLSSGSLPASKEIWIDLDQTNARGALTSDAWVTKLEPLEKRRLVRVVAWSSPWKADRGGFLEGPMSAATGLTLAKDFVWTLTRWSTRANPMRIAIDHAWMWTYIEFMHFDMISGHAEVLSPGIVVWAKDAKGNIVGGGASISNGKDSSMAPGLVYVLQNREDAVADDVDFVFATPSGTVIDMDVGKALDRMRQGEKDETDIRKTYPVPEHWHTFGMEGWLTYGPHQGRLDWRSAPVEDPTGFEPAFSIRNAATFVSGPRLRFHLDDTVLVDTSRRAVRFPVEKNLVSALDHLTRVQSPATAMPHVTSDPLGKDRNYLPAEVFVYDEAGEETEKVLFFTRFFDHEGVLHDLRRERVKGVEGTTRAVGARAAVADDHPKVDYSFSGIAIPASTSFLGSGLYQLHLFDTPLDSWGYRGVGARLFHLVVYASVFVDPGDTSDKVPLVLRNLDGAAKRWSPGHAVPEPGLEGKSYAMVPSAAFSDGDPVVLVRHFFSHRRQESPGPFRILLHKKVRANFAPSVRTLHLECDSSSISPDDDLTVKASDTLARDLDGSGTKWFTMAHEFGHAFSLPDEYLDGIDFEKHSDIPKVDQLIPDGGPARPFDVEARSMMRANRNPRVRHFYPHLFSVNNESALRKPLGNKSFALEHTDYPPGSSTWSPTRYALPSFPGTSATAPDPWAPVRRKVISRSRVELLLYRVGPDETAWGGLLSGTGPARRFSAPIDGILLVRTNYGLRVSKGVTEDDLATAARALLGALSAPEGVPRMAPMLAAPAPLPLRRIVVLFQPYFVLNGPAPNPSVQVEVAAADHLFASEWTPTDALGNRIRIRVADVGLTLIRVALGIPAVTSDGIYSQPLNDPLSLPELTASGIAADVAGMLGAPTGTEVVWQEAVD